MDLSITIPAAVGLGVLHSLEPGHGKGVITAYLVATRAKVKDAVLIGFITAVTHTISIVFLSLITTSAIKWLVPEQVTNWLELLSGMLITCIGANILYRHLRPRIVSLGKLNAQHTEACEHHHHHHGHSHHAHSHSHGTPNSLFRMITVGLLTGMIPCPSAMAIFLAALTADRIPLGLGLVTAFSLGGAITMSTLGVLVVRTGDTVKQLNKIGFVRSLNFVSSILILSLGVFITLQSLGHL